MKLLGTFQLETLLANVALATRQTKSKVRFSAKLETWFRIFKCI